MDSSSLSSWVLKYSGWKALLMGGVSSKVRALITTQGRVSSGSHYSTKLTWVVGIQSITSVRSRGLKSVLLLCSPILSAITSLLLYCINTKYKVACSYTDGAMSLIMGLTLIVKKLIGHTMRSSYYPADYEAKNTMSPNSEPKKFIVAMSFSLFECPSLWGS